MPSSHRFSQSSYFLHWWDRAHPKQIWPAGRPASTPSCGARQHQCRWSHEWEQNPGCLSSSGFQRDTQEYLCGTSKVFYGVRMKYCRQPEEIGHHQSMAMPPQSLKVTVPTFSPVTHLSGCWNLASVHFFFFCIPLKQLLLSPHMSPCHLSHLKFVLQEGRCRALYLQVPNAWQCVQIRAWPYIIPKRTVRLFILWSLESSLD